MSKRALRSNAARKSKRLRPLRSSQPPASVDEPSVSTSQTVRRGGPSGSSEPAFDEGDSGEIETAAGDDQAPSVPAAADDVTVSGLLAQHANEREDRLLSDFFSSPPAAPSDIVDEPTYPAMSTGSRRAMWTAASVFGASLLTIGVYTIYQQWIMPTPVELGVVGDPAASTSASNQALIPVEHAPALAHRSPPSAAEQAPSELVPSPSAAEPIAAQAATGAVATLEPQPSAAEPVVAAPAATTETTLQAITDQPDPTPATAQHAVEPEAQQANAPSYDDLLEVGRGFARRGQNSQALEAFRRALEAQPNAAAALSGSAYVYLNLGDRKLAKEFARRALAVDPRSSEGWIVLGAVEEMLGDRNAAREAYRKCASDAVGSYVAECRNLAR